MTTRSRPHHRRNTSFAALEYAARIDRVIDHLRAHLDQPLPLHELAKVANFSPFHFHRVFTATTGETVNAFTTRLRLQKAARALRYSSQRLTDIALDCGFSSSATFARTFRAVFAMTPSEYRQRGEVNDRKIRKALVDADEYLLPMSPAQRTQTFRVQVRARAGRRIAYLRVANAFAPGRVQRAFQTMRRWAIGHDLWNGAELFGMSADDPHTTPKHLYRYEVCLAPSRPLPAHLGHGISATELAPMRCATLRVEGDLRRVSTAWDYLYRDWLMHSRYAPAHAPALEIFRDKDRATDWNHFDLELCLPIEAW